jgi:hypothetical protein
MNKYWLACSQNNVCEIVASVSEHYIHPTHVDVLVQNTIYHHHHHIIIIVNIPSRRYYHQQINLFKPYYHWQINLFKPYYHWQINLFKPYYHWQITHLAHSNNNLSHLTSFKQLENLSICIVSIFLHKSFICTLTFCRNCNLKSPGIIFNSLDASFI